MGGKPEFSFLISIVQGKTLLGAQCMKQYPSYVVSFGSVFNERQKIKPSPGFSHAFT
jgi:hypothetical protein